MTLADARSKFAGTDALAEAWDIIDNRRALKDRIFLRQAQAKERANATRQKRAERIRELSTDIEALEASKAAERQRMKDLYKQERKQRIDRPRRRSRSRDGPSLDR